MAKIQHTTAQFDAAIRKVRADYADCSNVTADAASVREGKTIMNVDNTLVTGTLGSAEIISQASIEGCVVGSEVSQYPISATPKVVVNQKGYISEVADSATITKYIKTEERSATPKKTEQVVVPTNGKLIDKFTLAGTPIDPALKGIEQFNLTFPIPTMYTARSNYPRAYVSSGNTHDNVYLRSNANINDAFVYLVPVGSSLNSTNTITMIDPDTKKLKSDIIVLKPGDSITSSGTTYSPAGVLTFTTAGRITFRHTASFTACTRSSSSCILLLYIGGIYYVPMIDYCLFSHDYNGCGSYSSSGSAPCGGYFEATASGVTKDYYDPVVLFGNITNVYFSFYYGSSSSWEPMRMTFNYGISVPIIAEKEE